MWLPPKHRWNKNFAMRSTSMIWIIIPWLIVLKSYSFFVRCFNYWAWQMTNHRNTPTNRQRIQSWRTWMSTKISGYRKKNLFMAWPMIRSFEVWWILFKQSESCAVRRCCACFRFDLLWNEHFSIRSFDHFIQRRNADGYTSCTCTKRERERVIQTYLHDCCPIRIPVMLVPDGNRSWRTFRYHIG